jgi:sigma-B regulation protein RsbU (phosphoserine phosphatase)
MERFEVYGVNTPSRQVGGDYFDLVPTQDGAFFLAIADVSGKGVPAALLTSMLQASLRTQVETVGSVSAILHGMNGLVHSRTTAEQFATFFLARVDGASMRLCFSNAGHNYPILHRRNAEMRELVRGGLMLGMFAEARFEEEAIDLRPGDRVVFFTDGVSEAVNAADEEFGEARLARLVRELPAHLSAREITDRLLEELFAFLDGTEPQDDLTLMVLRVLEPAAAERTRGSDAVAAEAR